MKEVQVDIVGVQAAQAGLAGPADVGRARFLPGALASLLVKGIAKLGGDHHPVAPAGQCLAQDALAMAAAIDVGRVEKIDAQVKGAVDGADGRVDLVLPVVDGQIVPLPVQPADAGRAQADGADLDAAFAQCSFQDRHLSTLEASLFLFSKC